MSYLYKHAPLNLESPEEVLCFSFNSQVAIQSPLRLLSDTVQANERAGYLQLHKEKLSVLRSTLQEIVIRSKL